jgi:hypothetical protein
VRASWEDVADLMAAAHVHTVRRYGPDRIVREYLAPYLSRVDAEALSAGGAEPLELALDRLPEGARRRAMLSSDEHGGFAVSHPETGERGERLRHPPSP